MTKPSDQVATLESEVAELRRMVASATTTALSTFEMLGDSSVYPTVSALQKIREEAKLPSREIKYQTVTVTLSKGAANALGRI